VKQCYVDETASWRKTGERKPEVSTVKIKYCNKRQSETIQPMTITKQRVNYKITISEV